MILNFDEKLIGIPVVSSRTLMTSCRGLPTWNSFLGTSFSFCFYLILSNEEWLCLFNLSPNLQKIKCQTFQIVQKKRNQKEDRLTEEVSSWCIFVYVVKSYDPFRI